MQDPGKFRNILTGLGELYGKEVTEALAELYWRALMDYSDEQVTQAVTAGTKKWTCFGRLPTPGEIIQEIGGTTEDQALIAWESVIEGISAGRYTPVQFADTRIPRVVRAMGGWLRFLDCPTQYQGNLRREFEELYARTDPGAPETLYGSGNHGRALRIGDAPEALPEPRRLQLVGG